MTSSWFPAHPVTGKHYVLCISPEAGPYADIWKMYTEAARAREWLRVVPFNEIGMYRTMSFYDDPDVVFVIFEPTKFDPWPRAARKARVVGVYSEALGGDLLAAHKVHLDRFTALVHRYDAVAVHAPGVQEILSTYYGTSTDVRLLPIGWSPETMGAPDFEAERWSPPVFLGSEVGRRKAVIDRLASEMVIEWPRTVYGDDALAILRRSRHYLYVAHSLCSTFSTWRIWQALASGAALVAECASDADQTWPAVPGLHFVSLDTMEPSEVREKVLAVDLSVYAKRAYADLGERFSIDRVIEDYLVPLGT